MFANRKLSQVFFSIIAILTMIISSSVPSSVLAQSGDGNGRQVNAQTDGDGAKRQVNAQTGMVSFISPENGRVLSASKALGTSIRPQDPARALAIRYAPEFGLKDPARDLTEMKINNMNDGRVMVRYQQKYQGIPVMGGELIVNTNNKGDLYSMNGEVSPDLSLSTQPTIDSAQATETALQAVAKSYGKAPSDFVASEPALWIYDESLLRPSTQPVELVWRMDVTSADNSAPVRELVLVNAEKGDISLHFNQIDNAWAYTKVAPVQSAQDDNPPTDTATPLLTDTPLPTDTITEIPLPTETSTPTDTPTLTETTIPVETPIPTDTSASTKITPNNALSSDVEALAVTLYVKASGGSDSNTCLSVALACATINGAIGKATSGDTILVATGTYAGSGTEVVLIDKDITLSGGWNASFATQSGMSTINGQGTRRGISVSGGTVSIDRFNIQNGFTNDYIINTPAGGGIYIGVSTILNINTSIITASMGGGIMNEGVLTMNNSTVSNTLNGGGINTSYGSTTTINTSTVNNNIGNGIYSRFILTINNSSINHNGTGIYTWSSNTTVNNSTISGNNAGDASGGGVYAFNSSVLNFNNVTITGNVAAYGGGLEVEYSTVNLKNTIVAGNSATNGSDCFGTVSSAGYNLIGNTSGCTFSSSTGDLTNVTPNLGGLIGSPAYHPLIAGSPAINAGNPATCISTDQRGVSRVGNCDIGAFEYTTPGSAASIYAYAGTPQNAIPLSAFTIPLQVVVMDSIGSPVSGVTVAFTAPSSGASGTFADSGTRTTTAITNSGGVATSATLTANGIAGSYTVSATVSGVAVPANFSLSNVVWYVATTGNDANSCISTGSPCATINGAIGKALAGDTIKVATGTYTGSGSEVVLINKNITLLGGWNSAFTIQTGLSIIDGQGSRVGVSMTYSLLNITVVIEGFSVQNGTIGISSYGNLTLNHSVVKTNTAGGINDTGVLILNNSSVSNNSTNAHGGGIEGGGNVTLNNSTVYGNSAANGWGGGIRSGGTVTLNNSTVSGNTAAVGGGIYLYSGTVTLQNSIVAGNTAGTSPDCFGALSSTGYNILGNTTGCTFVSTTGDKTNVDPKLVPFLIGSPGYMPLQLASPAINSGNPVTCLSTDQRGVARVGNCDIGAYEYTVPGSATSLSIVNGNNQRSVVNLAFPKPLQVAALDNQGNLVSNVNITYTAPVSGASGTFTSTGNNTTSVLADAIGISTTSTFTANSQSGSYTVSASASGLASVTFSLQNVAWYVSSSGNDSNPCTTIASPCATINGAIGKATSGDLIFVTTGTYTGLGTEVVLINKNVMLSGGWNASFTTQSGISTINGQGARRVVTINNSFIANIERFSIVNGSSSQGAGIYNAGTLTVNNSNVSNNSSSSDSGGGIASIGPITLNNTTVNNNSTTYIGGGIYAINTLVLNNVTVSGNNASANGGGIYTTFGTINNTTISNNTSASSGSGIYQNYLVVGGSVSIKNSILAGNANTDCAGGSIVSSGYNIVGNNSNCNFTVSIGDQVGTNTNPVKPRITPLQNNSGPTLTHALMAGSPAIDTGNPATPGSGGNACLATDQRGVARPDGAHCDIGAFEGSVPWATASPLVSTYTANNTSSLPGTFLCDQSQPGCTNGSNPHADGAHKYAIGTYNFYANNFNRDSIDNNGMTITSTVHYCEPGFPCPYDNAYWTGTQIVYGSYYGNPLADDEVAHELTHGVTQYESNLFYYYQSGAINESLSDVFGEYYDQTNGQGNDTAGIKWLIGEDVTGLGAFRSMINPSDFGDPDKMTSPNYFTGADDNGGVHYNSGVNNKAVYLIVDGGSFNGKTVTGIGWEKTGAIYYEVQTNLLTSASDYSDLYLAVQQACTNLLGQHGIIAGDCTQVKNALDAVEMNTRQPFGDLEDPSFEYSYTIYPYWDQNSANFVTPLCTVNDCTDYGGAAGPRSGDVWGWFGGTTAYETASLSQTVYFPSGYPSLKLNFYFWIGLADPGSDANDKFIAQVDGVTVFSANATQKNSYSSYKLVSADVSGFATNALHTITFSSVTTGQVVNFNLDDVSLMDSSIMISGNAGVAGATLNYTDGTLKSVTADGSGNYSITVPFGWSGTVTPYKSGYIFTPINRLYTGLQASQTSQDYTVQACASCADVNVTIGGDSQGNYTLGSGEERRLSFNVSGGPVKVESSDPSKKIVTAIRLQSYVNNTLYSFAETMGVPSGLLSYKYYFPSYNNIWAPLNSQIRFSNLDANPTTIRVTIGGDNVWEQQVLGGEEKRLSFDVSGEPVIIESLDPAKKIAAAIRLQSYANNTLYSFAETMGIPAEQVSNTYYFPSYNNIWAPLNSQLRIGNLNASDVTVRVTIGGDIVWEDVVPGLDEKRLSFNVSGGPVKVESLDPDPSKKIVTAIRLQSYANNTLYSFAETMGVPSGLLSYKYYFPSYNNIWAPLNSQIRFSNLDANPTTIRVTIGGNNVWEQQVLGGEEKRLSFDVSGGPVIIESLDPAKKIAAAIRLQSYANNTLYSFAETMGIPAEWMSNTYYFPSYNNIWAPLNSQLRFGLP